MVGKEGWRTHALVGASGWGGVDEERRGRGTTEKALTPLGKTPVEIETVGPPDKVRMRSERTTRTVPTTRRRARAGFQRRWWQWCGMLPLLLLLLLGGGECSINMAVAGSNAAIQATWSWRFPVDGVCMWWWRGLASVA